MIVKQSDYLWPFYIKEEEKDNGKKINYNSISLNGSVPQKVCLLLKSSKLGSMFIHLNMENFFHHNSSYFWAKAYLFCYLRK